MAPQAAEGVGNRRPVIYLHLGTPKSGTTYLQNILWENRSRLKEVGIRYPGGHYLSHFHAALDLQDASFLGYRDPAISGAWERLVEEIRDWPGTTVISHENFSTASPEHAKAAAAALDFADVHVVLTVRDLARQIPAAWQEDIKNRHVLGFADYVRALREGRRIPQVTGFWRMQDPVDILTRWSEGVPLERIHVVTVPPATAPRELLWQRFAELVGIDPDVCDVSKVDGNASLGIAEVTMLRRFNGALDQAAVDWPAYERYVKGGLTNRVLRRRPGGARVKVPDEEYSWVVARAEQTIVALRRTGYPVVGDLAELHPPAPGEAASHPDAVDESAVAGVAIDTAAFFLTELVTEHKNAVAKVRSAQEELARRRAEHERTQQDFEDFKVAVAEERAKPLLKIIVRYLSERHRTIMRLRVAYWHFVEHLREWRQRVSGG